MPWCFHRSILVNDGSLTVRKHRYGNDPGLYWLWLSMRKQERAVALANVPDVKKDSEVTSESCLWS